MTNGDGERHDLPSRFAVFNAKNGKPDVVARWAVICGVRLLKRKTGQNKF